MSLAPIVNSPPFSTLPPADSHDEDDKQAKTAMVPRALALNDDAEILSCSTAHSGSVPPIGSNFSVTGGGASITQAPATHVAARPTGRVVLEALENTPSGPITGLGGDRAPGADSIGSHDNHSSKMPLSSSLLSGEGGGGAGLEAELPFFSKDVGGSDGGDDVGGGIGDRTSEAKRVGAMGGETNASEAGGGGDTARNDADIKSGNVGDGTDEDFGNGGGGVSNNNGLHEPLNLIVTPAKEQAAAAGLPNGSPKPRISTTGAGGRPIKLIHSPVENGSNARTGGGSFVGLRSLPEFFKRNGSKVGLFRKGGDEGSRYTDEDTRKTGGKWSMLYSSRSKGGDVEDDQLGKDEDFLASERARKNWRVLRAVFMALGKFFLPSDFSGTRKRPAIGPTNGVGMLLI